jgi:hypothetical protein
MNTRKGVNAMYARVIVFNCLLILAFSAFLYANVQPRELSVGYAREILCGTWVNRDCCIDGSRAVRRRTAIDRTSAGPDCGFSHEFEKVTHRSDGTYACFWAVVDEAPLTGGCYRIDDYWTDRAGNVWYEIFDSNPTAGHLSFMLVKIVRDGVTMECSWSLDGYPKRMSPPGSKYHTVYYRSSETG